MGHINSGPPRRILLVTISLLSTASVHAGFIVDTVIQLDSDSSSGTIDPFNGIPLQHTIEVSDSMVYTNGRDGNGLLPPFGSETFLSGPYGQLGPTKIQISGSSAPNVNGLYETSELVLLAGTGALENKVFKVGFVAYTDVTPLNLPYHLVLAPRVTQPDQLPVTGDPIVPFTYLSIDAWLKVATQSGDATLRYRSTIVSSRVTHSTVPEPASFTMIALLSIMACFRRGHRRPSSLP